MSSTSSDDEKKEKQPESLWQLVQPDWPLLVLGSAGMGVSSLTNLLLPRLMGVAIDVSAGAQSPPMHLSHRGFLFAVLSVFLTGAAASFTRVLSFGMVAERTATRIRKRLFQAILHQDILFFHETKTGALLSRIANDAQVTANAVVDILANGFRSMNSALGASLMLLSISPKLTIVALTMLPVVGSGAMVFSKFTKSLAKNQQNALADLVSIAEERINNVMTVKLFAQEQREIQLFNSYVEKEFSKSTKVKASRGLFMGTLSFSINSCLFSVLYFGGSLVASGEMTVGSLASFSLYSGFMGLGFSGLSSCYSDIKKTKEASKSLFSLLDNLSENNEKHDLTLDRIVGNLAFKDVSFFYPSRPEIPVLSNFNLTINSGQVVAIVGRSGAGKSTVASLISCLLKPTSGYISLDGVDTSMLDPYWLRSNIGTVSQDTDLFAISIMENIKYGNPEATDEEAMAAAKEAHAHTFIMKFPDQYNTLVGERGMQLSGGQKQRISIARAILKNPRILILDEATSSLDGKSESIVKEALNSAMKNRTVLVIAHRITTIENADSIAVLQNGKIVEMGTYSQLVENNSSFCDLIASSTDIGTKN